MTEYTTISKELTERYRQVINSPAFFSGANDIRVTELSPERTAGVLTSSGRSRNPRGLVHGGCLATLADTVAGSVLVCRGWMVVTLDFSMQYLKAASGGAVTCTATPRKLGRTICVCEVTLTDESGDTVAIGTFTFFVQQRLDETEMLALVEQIEQNGGASQR